MCQKVGVCFFMHAALYLGIPFQVISRRFSCKMERGSGIQWIPLQKEMDVEKASTITGDLAAGGLVDFFFDSIELIWATENIHFLAK